MQVQELAGHYDYVIVGAGPAGLTLAWYLTQFDKTGKKKILILEREKTIGGCHRVRRTQDGYFTEHGPRIYTSGYLNFRRLLTELGGDFQQMFTPYKFNMTKLGEDSITDMRWWEISALIWAYINLTIWPNFGLDQSLGEYMNKWNFSYKTKDYLDRVCRLTDGAGADRYTLYEFLQLLNQNFFYQIMQPRRPNDLGLFPLWQTALEQTGQIEILLDRQVIALHGNGSQNIESLTYLAPGGNRQQVTGNHFILAIPPEQLVKILFGSPGKIPKAFGPIDQLRQWEKDCRYIIYLPVTFHWKKHLRLPTQWGFSKTDWGLVYIVLSDYMTFNHPHSKTVISSCLTRLDVPSRRTGKTANETSDRSALMTEAWAQLQESYVGIKLPRPDKIILSPGVYREEIIDENGQQGIGKSQWISKDSAFILTSKGGYLSDMQSQLFNNLWTVGVHTGQHSYEFTSMEAAINNALELLYRLQPETRGNNRVKGLTGWSILKVVTVFVLVVGLTIFYFGWGWLRF